ncbi:MAG: YdcF family protein [Nitriliruptoraceae bacterium]
MWGWLLTASAALTLVLGIAFVSYLLPKDDVPEAPDAVVVLGGAGPERAELGIELAQRYDALLVLSGTAEVFGEQQGRTCSLDAICFEPVPGTTRGEAQMVADMADEYGWEHVTVATSAFHTTRSRFLFRQCLDADRVSVVGTVREGAASTTPWLLFREGLGVIAGATFQRAC